MESTLRMKVWTELADGAAARAAVDTIRDNVLKAGTPPECVATEPRHKDGMAAAELLIIALSHIAITGLIDGVRMVWDMYSAPVKVELPDGTVLTVQGGSSEFVEKLRKSFQP